MRASAGVALAFCLIGVGGGCAGTPLSVRPVSFEVPELRGTDDAPLVQATAAEPVSRDTSALGEWFSVSGNADVTRRETQFSRPNHDGSFVPWEVRAELWLPPHREALAWGPYVRLAGVGSNRDDAFENYGQVGAGVHVFPFSDASLQKSLGRDWSSILGPTRLYAEANSQHWEGGENDWRPDRQIRGGLEYYKAIHVNETTRSPWAEVFGQFIWQSSNDFDEHYDSLIFGTAGRVGVRLADSGFLAAVSPYALIETSRTENSAYWWENRAVGGLGLRFDPDLRFLPRGFEWLSRFVVFAEYLPAVHYFRSSPPHGVPDYDFRIGISFSIGDFFR